jgi:sulfite reductase alpha subunit-like flavoprotein
MSNRLNFSSIDDAWGIPQNNRKEEDDLDPGKKFNYKKPVDNTLAINSNEITELKQEIQKLKLSQELKTKEVEHFNQKTIKPCSLIDEHVKKCSMCKNKLLKELSIVSKNNKQIEHYKQNQEDDDDDYEDNNNYSNEENNYNILETFENITPSQKNLLLIIIYGVLIIVVTDLVIKDPVNP